MWRFLPKLPPHINFSHRSANLMLWPESTNGSWIRGHKELCQSGGTLQETCLASSLIDQPCSISKPFAWESCRIQATKSPLVHFNLPQSIKVPELCYSIRLHYSCSLHSIVSMHGNTSGLSFMSSLQKSLKPKWRAKLWCQTCSFCFTFQCPLGLHNILWASGSTF